MNRNTQEIVMKVLLVLIIVGLSVLFYREVLAQVDRVGGELLVDDRVVNADRKITDEEKKLFDLETVSSLPDFPSLESKYRIETDTRSFYAMNYVFYNSSCVLLDSVLILCGSYSITPLTDEVFITPISNEISI